MNDDFFTPEDLDRLVDNKLASKSARLRALGLLDEISQAKTALGVEAPNETIAQHMKDSGIFDPREAVQSFAAGVDKGGQPEDRQAPMTTAGMRQAVSKWSSSLEPEEPSYDLSAALAAKLT